MRGRPASADAFGFGIRARPSAHLSLPSVAMGCANIKQLFFWMLLECVGVGLSGKGGRWCGEHSPPRSRRPSAARLEGCRAPPRRVPVGTFPCLARVGYGVWSFHLAGIPYPGIKPTPSRSGNPQLQSARPPGAGECGTSAARRHFQRPFRVSCVGMRGVAGLLALPHCCLYSETLCKPKLTGIPNDGNSVGHPTSTSCTRPTSLPRPLGAPCTLPMTH